MKIKIIIERALLLGAIAAFAASCAKTPIIKIASVPGEAAAKTAANSPVLCAYKGKIAVKANGSGEKSSFGALFDRTCSGDAFIAVLGTLNTVAAEVRYNEGKVEVSSSDKETGDYLRMIADSYGGFIKSYVKFPVVLPSASDPVSMEGDSYVFVIGDAKAYAGSDFRIYKYELPDITLTYKWAGDSISNIAAATKDAFTEIRFLNKNGWSGSDAGR